MKTEEKKECILTVALFDSTKKYRYFLKRTWDESKPVAVFIMLNPSTADDVKDDPTIRRCMGFAREWGYGGISVVNLFAYRSTDPKGLTYAIDPVGPENLTYIATAVADAGIIIAAWGGGCPKVRSVLAIGSTIKAILIATRKEICCLGVTKSGMPKHPLYLRKDIKPMPFPTK